MEGSPRATSPKDVIVLLMHIATRITRFIYFYVF